MANITPQPDSPDEWKQYATSDAVTQIPLTKDEKNSDDITTIRRDIYMDASEALKTPKTFLYTYSDVLAFTKKETIIEAPDGGMVTIMTRVISATAPTHLKLVTDKGCIVRIYATIIDQPLKVSVNGSEPILLEIGTGTEYVGVVLTVLPDKINQNYQKSYPKNQDDDFEAQLSAQLRIALVLFWRNTSIAISICAYVAAATTNPPLYNELNTQAAALGQQLAAQTITGPDMNYAPVLVIDDYKSTMNDILKALSEFETQYNRFQDKKESLDNQKQAWNAMMNKAINDKSLRISARNLARSKHTSAKEAVSRCSQLFESDIKELEAAKRKFREGLEAWERKQLFKAVFMLFTALYGEPHAILTSGDITGITDIVNAVTAVENARKNPDDEGMYLKSESLGNLGDCMQSIEKLYFAMDSVVQAVKDQESNPDVDIPTIGDISGTSAGDANAAEIMTLAAWDIWAPNSNDQMTFGLNESIGGAREYQLALQKHSINGKQLAQAQAETIKAGQEYVYAQMEVIIADKDIKALQDLLAQYCGQEAIYAQAEVKFYNRFMAMRTSLVMEMQNVIWAYKYWALEDSQIVLDSLKTTAAYSSDLVLIDLEIEAVNTRYVNGFQKFKRSISSNQLPSDYGSAMIEGLKGEDHRASFTFAPSTDKSDYQGFAGIFSDGNHFRVNGLETIMTGVIPKPDSIKDGVTTISIQISTSGVYADIQNNKAFNFTSPPKSIRFEYDLTASGDQGETHIPGTFSTEHHAEPTPFTQWTITVRNPEKFDWGGLTEVKLFWTGNAEFTARQRASFEARLA
ncbi:hypothetical protein NHQ30_002656 [Ciborinia camelliae]|nr:hypothetical protein NHQ30_002656 [Ciborinia camelliae]